jgi:hypothetical protein
MNTAILPAEERLSLKLGMHIDICIICDYEMELCFIVYDIAR